jgi:superfamily II DNA or RNA helicase
MEILDLSEEQKLALKHIDSSFNKKINPICALGMGMGKTRVACEIIKKFSELFKNKKIKILIIIKASNYSDPWESELIKDQYLPNIIFLHSKERFKYISKGKYFFHGTNIILTSYETLRLDIDNGCYELSEYFDLIIFDELHTIVNSKRLSKRIIAISSLKARHKLALTGTPFQNFYGEIGLINIFLNDFTSFVKLVRLFAKIKKEKESNKKDKIKSILDKGYVYALKNRVVFRFIRNKAGIKRYAAIISVPIEKRMYIETESSHNKFSPRQRMFLSHPNSVLKKNDKKTFPRCTKADAVKYILESTLENEKVIIFSLYISVLNAYFEYCTKLGYNSILITGNDKGGKLQEKLTLFRYSNSTKILFTTLQKSSEGLNLDVATHVIILEFWWNPQKLFQAMSRINRFTQKRNIFSYMLCYNYKGEIIDIEKRYLNKLAEKVQNTNAVYSWIDEDRIKTMGGIPSQYYELPEIITFKKINTLKDELTKYLSLSQHTILESEKLYDEFGTSKEIVNNKMMEVTAEYLSHINTLTLYPWHLEYIQDYIIEYYSKKINESGINRSLLNMKEMPSLDPLKPMYDKLYPILYVRYWSYTILIKGESTRLPVMYILGKRKSGKYDILLVNFNMKKSLPLLLSDIKKNGILDISLIVSGQEPGIIQQEKEEISKIFPNAKIELCLTKLYQKLTTTSFSTEEIHNIDIILRQKSKSEALELCRNLSRPEIGNRYIFKRLFKYLSNSTVFYEYDTDKRVLIGTTNIIQYLGFDTQILLNTVNFENKMDTRNFIVIVSQNLLNKGNAFIPTWDKLIQPVNVK